MKRMLAALPLVLVAGLGGVARAADVDVGVSIAISQPGVYGRIDIGRFPQPAVVVAQPVLIAPPRVVVRPQPVYLWVPPGHQKKWSKHCAKYKACGVPVYFVRDGWYRDHVMKDAPRAGERRNGGDRDRDARENGRRDHPGHHDKGRGKHD